VLDQQSALSNDLRSYLTSLEQRLQKLEGLFAELLPDVNLEDMLASSSVTSQNPVLTPESTKMALKSATPTQGGDDTFSETLPDDPDGFDWREEATDDNDLADGMASLSIEPHGAGYLGLY